MPLTRLPFLLVVASLALVASCDEAVVGTNADAGSAPSLCQTAATMVCQKACACSSGPECYTAYGDGVLTVEYDNLDHCMSFETVVCEAGDAQDVAKQDCIDQLSASSCQQVTHDGTTQQALAIPMECADVNL